VRRDDEDVAGIVRSLCVFVGVCASVVAGCGSGSSTDEASPTSGSSASTPLTTPAPASTTAAPRDPQHVLDQFRDSIGAPAALALVNDGGHVVVVTSGAGQPDAGPLDDATTFRIASVTKPLVAALVLDAVRRGELGLGDDVADLLPGVLRPGPTVTVRMLLDHTSGVFNAGDEGDIVADIEHLADPTLREQAHDLLARYLAGEAVGMSDDLYVAIAETHDRYFAPGEGYHYSNVNYQLAGMVLEQVTGQPLAELFSSRMAAPLGLTSSALAADASLVPELHGYYRDANDNVTDDTYNIVALGNGGGGGVISTPAELMTMMQAVVVGDYLPADLVAEMRRPTAQSKDGSYGLGLATYPLRCGAFLGHGGSMSGTNSIALVSEDGLHGVVAVVNLDADPAPNMTALAESLLCP
jgi:D-alanyl-D-alanine carboxypeptidase